MTHLPSTSTATARTIGKLCVGGDWACANGDFGGLRHVAQQLADYVPEPTHCELATLADACDADPDRAAELWQRLKRGLYREGHP
jgi:hypothetical protein